MQSLELHEEFADQARSNLRTAGTRGAEVTCTDGTELASEGAFDAIVLTASLPDLPAAF